MKFKVGDKVKLVRTDDEGSYYKNYLGKIYTISSIDYDEIYDEKYAHFEETEVICPYLKNLELVKKEYTYEDLKKSPIGTKITFENGKVLVKTYEERYESYGTCRFNNDLKGMKDSDYGKIIKIDEPEYKTVYETKSEILDEVEKRYLRNIIRPFKNKVKAISKRKGEKEDYIEIYMKREYETFDLPCFKKGTMYKGMEEYKEYTLEELGL